MPAPLQSLSLLACPSCRGELVDLGGHPACKACALTFATGDGIVDLRQHRKDYYFNPVERKEMRDIIANVPVRPWPETVRRFMREVRNNPDWLDNLVGDGRYAWRLLLDIPKDGTALDLGCGLGNLAQNLAPSMGRVFGMDLTMERLEFARQRFLRFDCADKINLVAAGDGEYLPFRDGTFDLVTLSGVLEWIPDDERAWEGARGKFGKGLRMLMSFFGKTNPRRVQLAFLREIRRIMKPTGQLFVAIENRFGYEYFLGMPDHHSGLQFNSLLPRFAANLYSIARARKPYRTYTHSSAAFARLFRNAGFAGDEIYGLTPGYTHLAEIIPAHRENPIWASDDSEMKLGGMKRSPFFVPAYGIIANSADRSAGSALINRIGARIEGETGSHTGEFRVSRWRITGKDKAVLNGHLGERSVIVRLPLNAMAEAAEERNWNAIVQSRADPHLASLVPQPIVRGVEQRVSFYVESKIPGETITRAILNDRDPFAALDEERSFLERFCWDAQRRTAAKLEGAVYDRLVQQPLARVAEVSGFSSRTPALSDFFRDLIHGAAVEIGRSHGDFTTDNIFIDQGRIAGIVDWEESKADGLPLLDVIAYFESVCRVRSSATSVETTFLSIGGGLELLSAAEVAVIERAFESFGTPLKYRRGMAMLAWLYHCDAMLRTRIVFDARAIEQRVAGLFRLNASTWSESA